MPRISGGTHLPSWPLAEVLQQDRSVFLRLDLLDARPSPGEQRRRGQRVRRDHADLVDRVYEAEGEIPVDGLALFDVHFARRGLERFKVGAKGDGGREIYMDGAVLAPQYRQEHSSRS